MDWQKKVSLWWAKNFRPLVVALLVGCGVHYTIYANQLGTMDAVHIGALYIADGWPEHLYWETEQGRWALRLVDMLRGGINQPALSALLMLFLYALAGVLLTDLFGVRSRTAKYLIPLTLVCAPYVAEIEFFHYCSVSYALSFLLAVLAVQSAVCGLRFAWLAGTVCMAFSLGMYQANLSTAAGLCVMLLILAVLRCPGAWKATGLTALRMVLMGGSGAVLYMLILKVFLRLYDVGLSGVNGINAVGLDTLRSLPLGLKNAYFDFYAYFFTHGIAQNHYGQIAGYLLLFVLAALAGLRWLIVLHDRKAAAAAVVLVALLPAAANVTDVINTGATVALRMAGSLAIVVPFAIAVIDAAPALTERAFSWGMALCTAFCAVLLRGFAVQVNNDAAVMLKQKTTVVNLANRLCTRLEENADYQNGTEVVILGEPKRGAYPEESPLKPMAGELAQFGPLSYDPTFNAHGWYVLVWDELGVQLNECADETVRAISNSDAFKAMPNYPADGCIQTIDGVVTLKVADFPF